MKKCKQDYIYPNLEKAIKASGLKLYAIASRMGMHVVSLNNKRIGWILWRDSEKQQMKQVLGYKGSVNDLFYTEWNISRRKYKNRLLEDEGGVDDE